MKRLIIHIGTEKTGTTSIQQALFNNRKELHKQGVHFLQSAGSKNNRLLPRYCMSLSRFDNWFTEQGIVTEERKLEFKRRFRKEFFKELDSLDKNIDTVVISSEHFHSRLESVEEINELKKLIGHRFERVEIVLYLRHQLDVCISHYSTHLKYGGTQELNDFIASRCKQSNYYYNYGKIIENWAQMFGADNIIPVPFSKSFFHQGDLLTDFFFRIKPNLDFTKVNLNLKLENESLSSLGCNLLLKVNKAYPRFDPKLGFSKVNEKLNQFVLAHFVGKPTGADKALLDKKVKDFEASNHALSRILPNGHVLQSNYLESASSSKEKQTVDGDLLLRFLDIFEQFDVLEQKDADFYRDAALYCECDDVEIANELMKVAYAKRKHGPKINSRLEHYKNLLADPINNEELYEGVDQKFELLSKPEVEVWSSNKAKEALRENKVLIRKNFPLYNLGDGFIDWDDNPLNDKTWRLYFTSFAWVAGYESNKEDCETVEKYTRSLIEYCLENEFDEKSPFWDDHAVAYRASYLAYTFTKFKLFQDDPDSLEELITVVDMHINILKNFLGSDRWKLSNHTLFHAEGLSDLAIAFVTEGRARLNLLEFSRDKVDELVRSTITASEGTVKEHALFYHVFLMGRLYSSCSFFSSAGVPLTSLNDSVFKSMMSFLLKVIPTGRALPGVGDTKHRSTFDQKYIKDFDDNLHYDDESKFIKSRGSEGSKPQLLSEYPTDGYYLFRTYTGENELYGLFMHKAFKGPHGHWDGASFVTYYKGTPVLIDSGGPYKYGNYMRFEYFQTQLAHNTVILNDAPREYTTKIVSSGVLQDDAGYVLSLAKFTEGVHWMRLFVHVGNRYQMAVDLLLGDNSCRFKVRFHLDNAIKLTSGADFSELKGENFSIFSASDSLLFDPKNRKLLSEGVQKLSKDLTFSKAKQSKNDIEGTFVTTKDGELEATNSMEFLMEPNSVSSVIFSPEKQRKLSTRFLDGALEIGVSDNKGTIEDTFVLNLRKLKLSKV